MNYFPFHIGDFRSGTVNMSRMSRWIYRDMLDVYYDNELPLSLDLDVLCDEIGVEQDDERRIVERLLRFKFIKTDDGYRHGVCERVIAEYHAKADTARTNGKLGGRPKKANGNPEKPSGFLSGSYPDAIGNPVATGSQANQEPRTNNQEPVEVQTHSDAEAPGIVLERRADVVEAIQDEVPLALIAKKAVQPRIDYGDDARAVFSYWQQQRGHDRAKLDDKRAKAIKARIKDGYTVGDLCRAIEGIAKSAHHMGQNDARTVYDDIELICRTAANVDKFAKLAGPAPALDHGLQRQIDVLNEWMEKP